MGTFIILSFLHVKYRKFETKKNYSYLNPILRSTEQDLVLVSFEPLRYPYISFCFDIGF